MVLLAFHGWAASFGESQIVSIGNVTLDHRLAPRQISILDITIQIVDGWHINSNHPLSEDFIPTRVEVATPAEVTAGNPIYPPAELVKLGFSSGEQFSVFTGSEHIKVPLTAGAGFKSTASEPGTLKIDYQACNDNECMRPTSVSEDIDLASMSAGSAPPEVRVEPETAGTTLTKVFANHGYFLGFLLVFLGGLALNLTPCVYPLIGVTIAYFGNQSGSHRKVAALATTYVLGIALMFSGVGVAVALSGGLFGAALQNPYVITAIAAVLVLLALSSFGVFVMQAPQWMMRWAGVSRPGYFGALLMGLGMGVIAAPCIGPIVLGLLLMVERSGSALFGFALFFTLAIGLGLPYIGLAMAAGSIRQLPRSGEWLRWTEMLFGFVLIGLALYFLETVVPGHLIERMLPWYAIAAALYLAFVTSAGRSWRPFLLFRTAVGIVAIVWLVYLVIPHAPRTALRFEPFADGALASARAAGKPVLVDFRADWCIPCREMEKTTFRDPGVVEAAARFVRLRADLTEQDIDSEQMAHHFDVKGVPTTLFIDSSGKLRQREVGYVGPGQFLADLKQIR